MSDEFFLAFERAFTTRFLFVPHKRAQTYRSIPNACVLAELFAIFNLVFAF